MINKKLFFNGGIAGFVLCAALLVTLTGCVGFVGGGGAAFVAPGPDVVLFDGGSDRGRDVHAYSNRGYTSRAAAHPAFAGHGGGR